MHKTYLLKTPVETLHKGQREVPLFKWFVLVSAEIWIMMDFDYIKKKEQYSPRKYIYRA